MALFINFQTNEPLPEYDYKPVLIAVIIGSLIGCGLSFICHCIQRKLRRDMEQARDMDGLEMHEMHGVYNSI